MNDQAGKDRVLLMAFLFDQATAKQQKEMLGIIDNEVVEMQPETVAEKRWK